jgi:HEAT repeat protein
LIAMLALSRDEENQKRHGGEAFVAQNALLRAGRPAAEMVLEVMRREDQPVHRAGVELQAGEDVDRAIGVLIEAHARQPRRLVGMAAGIIGTVSGPDAIGTITAAATRGPDELRFSALWILVHIDDGAAIEPLGRLLAQEVGNPGNTGVLAARGLGRHRAAAAIDALIQALPAAAARDDRGDLRHEIRVGLRAAGAVAVPGLITVLREGTDQLRLIAAETLSGISDPRAYDPLVAALHDPNGVVRWMAADALGRLGDLRACDALAERLNDTNVHARWGALWALAELHDPRVVNQLINVLRGPHRRFPFPYSRRHHVHPSHKPRAQRALEMIGDPAVEPLIRVLQGGLEPEYAQVCAAESLGRLGDRRAVGPLLYVGEANSAVRRAAIDALAHLQAPEAIGPLILIREDPSTTPEIARAADAALTATAGSPARHTLTELLASPDAEERDAAAWALKALHGR